MILAYLRASTDKQDASRAKKEVLDFISDKNTNNIPVQLFIENASGSCIDRPVLNEMLETAQDGSILVVEKMDRLTRLEWSQWQKLHAQLKEKEIKIVCVDQPMTHDAFAPSAATSPIMAALSNFILDLAASMARDDYETRKKRQAQGIEKAKAIDEARKAQGLERVHYKGKPIDTELHDKIKELHALGMSKLKISKTLGCSRTTVYKALDTE
ncbi:recombinase family protein [Photobacterium damselae]|uniref:recombinase family protein n=1 Tax=Photobacterium damselae TaxID=38293 RepID=UPI003709F6B7